MEVDRMSEWRAAAALKPQYQPVHLMANNAVSGEQVEKKRRSIFGRRKEEKREQAKAAFITTHKSQEEEMEMEPFFKRYLRIRRLLHALDVLYEELDRNNRTQAAAANEEQLAECDRVAESLSQEMTKTSASIRTELCELRDENERLKGIAPVGSGYLRIREIQHGCLLRQFTRKMSKFQQGQRQAHEQTKEAVKRQLRIVNPGAEEEELDAACDDPNASVMLRSSIYAIASKEGAQRIFDQMEQRRQSMLRVEEGIAAIAQLYNDMYGLLEEQQGNLDSLETFLQGAEDYLEKASGEMDTAVEHQKNIRKMKCMII